MSVTKTEKKWLIKSFSSMFLILLLVTIASTIFIHNYYYKSVQYMLDGSANGVSSYFSSSDSVYSDFESDAYIYAQNFQNKDKIELTIFDYNGNPLINSAGFVLNNANEAPDYEIAKQSKNGYGMFAGKIDSNEKIMAVTQIIKNSNGQLMGSVRYVTSLEQVDKQIIFIIFAICVICATLVLSIIIIIFNYIKKLINPLDEVVNTANLVAQGCFDARIQTDEKQDEKIKKLCETVNNMASELQASEKMKNDFISSVSHELRTPLTAIRGWAETMKMSGFLDEDTMNKGMQVIINETKRLSGIVEELLDFSHIQNKNLNLMLEKTDILAELDEAVYVYKEKAASENKHIVFDSPEMLPPILADKNKMRQVFVNVIDNALKYSDEGATITIVAKREELNMVISISDRGAGISKDDLPRVKEKFFKANTSKRGSGIGLAIADEIMIAHSGKLDIESKEGVGTTVYIILPILENEDLQEQEVDGI